LISSGGNSGSQSATLVITALTAGDVHLSDWLRVVRRELIMGGCLGGFLAAISGIIIYMQCAAAIVVELRGGVG
jgi:magnesium transporter